MQHSYIELSYPYCMHALVLDKEGLTLQKRKSRVLKSHEARLKILAAGLCQTDIHVADGKLPVSRPLVLGHEFSALVIEVGADCKRVKKGDLVSADPRSPQGFLGIDTDGAFANELVISENNLYTLPKEISPLAAAFLEPIAACLAPCKYLADRSVKGLVVGTGRIANLTVKLLHVKGYELFNTSNRLEQIETSSQHVVIATSFTESQSSDFTRILHPGGLLIIKCRPTKSMRLDARMITLKELSIKGAAYADFEQARTYLAEKKLDLTELIGETFPLEKYEGAFELARQGISRKVFLKCAE